MNHRDKLTVLFGDWIIEDIEAIENWLGNEITITPRGDLRNDHASRKNSEIELGLRSNPIQEKFRPIFRRRLVHEALHLKGLNHGEEARGKGYFSNLSRDRYSEKVMKEELGWEPPDVKLLDEYGSRKQEWEGEKEERRRKEANYIVYCPGCGTEWYRKKKSAFVKHPSDYHCKLCGTSLKSKTRYGVPIPESDEYRYEYGCPECDWWKGRGRKTKTIKNIENYHCKNCGGDLIIKGDST